MKVVYENQVKAAGECVEEFKDAGMFIIFAQLKPSFPAPSMSRLSPCLKSRSEQRSRSSRNNIADQGICSVFFHPVEIRRTNQFPYRGKSLH